MAVIEDVRPLGAELERSYQVYVRGRLKFRVKQIVYVAFSLDETVMGFAFPKEERDALVAAEPDTFLLPRRSDLRYHWVEVRLAAIPSDGRRVMSSEVAAARPPWRGGLRDNGFRSATRSGRMRVEVDRHWMSGRGCAWRGVRSGLQLPRLRGFVQLGRCS